MTTRTIRAPRGTELRCKGWPQEAALRMLMNNLDPEVAERPQDLVVYGGTGKAARSWEAFDVIVRELVELGDDETLLVQSGKAVGVLRTHADAPRVLIANSNLVPHWATWEKFWELEKAGLMMYGQMTAGSWIYIGTQGILQGTYETFASAARVHFSSTGGTLAGRLVVSGGLGGMGGAQPLAVTMNGGVFLGIDIDPSRIERRLATRYLDVQARDLDEALKLCSAAKSEGRALSVGLEGNVARVLPELLSRGVIPDLVTDQTSAHDPLNGYVPAGLELAQAAELRKNDPHQMIEQARRSMAEHVRALLELSRRGAHAFDYGNNLRGQALLAGEKLDEEELRARIPGFVPAYIRPLFCEGKGPFRWVALSGDPNDIAVTDQALKALFPDNAHLHHWLDMAAERVAFQGLPARICWLGYGERALAGRLFNQLVRDKKVKAPLVIGRDHLDSGSVASPNRETEAMRDGSDAVSDWVFLNALVNCAAGATWVSVHHGGGVGIGYSQHAGMVVLADGTDAAERRLERVLTTDPAMGVLRHADAGYPEAISLQRSMGRACRMDPDAGAGGDADADVDVDVVGIGELFNGRDFIHGAAVSIRGGRVVYAGPTRAPDRGVRQIDAGGRLVTPGLVEPHAHPIFAGSRAHEFDLRAQGRSYLEIQQAGGGILSTVRATRSASDQELLDGTRRRLDRFLLQGVTTVEAKSGYDLTIDGELRLLALLGQVRHLVALSPTLLAHVPPPDQERGDWVRQFVAALPRARGLADAVDVYCDAGAYTLDETRAILSAARGHGFALRAHAEQFTHTGVAELAASLGARSVEHLEQLDDAGRAALARSGTVCNLLPGAALTLKLPWPDARRLFAAGCRVALGTDCNPGSSLTESLPLMMSLGCMQLGMSCAEAWRAVTVEAAHAVGRDDAGRLSEGARGDLVVWDADDHRQVAQHYGVPLVKMVLVAGRVAVDDGRLTTS